MNYNNAYFTYPIGTKCNDMCNFLIINILQI